MAEGISGQVQVLQPAAAASRQGHEELQEHSRDGQTLELGAASSDHEAVFPP